MERERSGSARTIAIAVASALVFCVASCAAGIGLMTWAVRRAPSRGAAEREAIEDESLRFRFRRPGPGWRLLEPEEAARLRPDSSAFAVHAGTGSAAIVIVEPAYGASLDAAGTTLRSAYVSSGTELGSWEPTRVAGRPALRALGTGTYGDASLSIAVAVLLHQDAIYQLACTTTRSEGPPLDAAIAAFELMDGPVVFEPRVIATPDGEGPLWRVRGGVLESGVGLRVRGGDGWGALAGAQLAELSDAADVGITRGALTITITALPEHGADPELVRARRREQVPLEMGAGPEALLAPADAIVAGRTVPLVTFRVEDGLGFDYAHGVLVDEGRAFEILAFSPAPGEVAEQLGEGLSRIELMTLDEQRALERDTAHAASDEIGPGTALRRGTFRAYEEALRWRAPSDCWRGAVGEAADLREPGAALFIECPRLGITGALWIEAVGSEPSDPSVEHAWAIDEIFFGEPPIDPAAEPPHPTDPRAPFGAVTGMASRGEYTVDGAEIAYRLFTVQREGLAIQWALWYPRAAGEEAAREAGAAFEAMGVDPDAPRESTSEPGLFEDRRLGFAFEDRASRLRFTEEPRSDTNSRMVVGSGGRLVISATHTSGIDVSGLAMDAVQERVLANRRSMSPLGQPEESTGTLGGEPCRVLRWSEGSQRFTMRITQHGGVIVAMITQSSLFGSSDQRSAEAFRFVDP